MVLNDEITEIKILSIELGQYIPLDPNYRPQHSEITVITVGSRTYLILHAVSNNFAIKPTYFYKYYKYNQLIRISVLAVLRLTQTIHPQRNVVRSNCCLASDSGDPDSRPGPEYHSGYIETSAGATRTV